MRTKLTPLAAVASLTAACSGWLIDYSGTKCNDDGSCGGKLVCVAGTCRSKSSLGSDAASSEDASVADDAQVRQDAAGGDAASSEDASTTGDAQVGQDAAAGDAASPEDASAAGDAQVGQDAGASRDAAAGDASISPPGECGDGGWCVAQLPARDGGWDLTSIAGSSARDIWVGGNGPALLHWNGARWADYSKAVADDGRAAGYPVAAISVLIVDNYDLVYAGSAPPDSIDPHDTTKFLTAACGFKSLSSSGYPDNPFAYQADCSESSFTMPWTAGHGRGLGLLLVGADHKQFFDNSLSGAEYRGSFDRSINGVDYYGAPNVTIGNDYEAWGAGPGGVLCHDVEYDCSGTPASAVGGPSGTSDFYAVLSFPSMTGALFVGGQGSLYECERGGDFGTPNLRCQNGLLGGSTIKILGLVGTKREDVWAWGVNGTAAVVLQRTSANTWATETPPLSGNVKAMLRTGGLVVIVADKGLVVSKVVP